MAFITKIYDPDQVLVYFAGALIQGFADGEFITVEMLSDAFNDVVGTDGEVARSKSNDRRGTVTIKLLQTSLSNAFLSGVHGTDLEAPGGAGVAPFSMQDLQGGTVVASEGCITKYPDNSMDRTVKSREWVIRLARIERLEGGNG